MRKTRSEELLISLEEACAEWPDNQTVQIGFIAKDWRLILAALRSTPEAGDQGAEATWPRKPAPPSRCHRDIEWIKDYRRLTSPDLREAIREHDAALRSTSPLPTQSNTGGRT